MACDANSENRGFVCRLSSSFYSIFIFSPTEFDTIKISVVVSCQVRDACQTLTGSPSGLFTAPRLWNAPDNLLLFFFFFSLWRHSNMHVMPITHAMPLLWQLQVCVCVCVNRTRVLPFSTVVLFTDVAHLPSYDVSPHSSQVSVHMHVHTLTLMFPCVLSLRAPRDWFRHKSVLSSRPLKLWSHRYVCAAIAVCGTELFTSSSFSYSLAPDVVL